MAKSNYENYTKEQLIAELKKLNKRKKYGLVWEEEKTKEQFETEAEGNLPVLVEDKKREIKTDANQPTHILIEGDNYHALSVLNYTHAKSIDVIYIDPPYNTGARDWKYNNNYVDKEDTFRHSKWISMMNNRLKLAKKLLSDSGVLICSIDEYEVHNIRHLLDQLFGEENKLGMVTILHNPKGRNLSKFFSPNSEFMLVYAKNFNYAKFNDVAIDEEVLASFDLDDADGKYRLEPFMRVRNSWTREKKPKCWYPIYISRDLKDITLEKKQNYYELFPITKDGREMAWKNIPKTFKDLNKGGYFVGEREDDRIQVYHKYKEQQVFKNVWTNKKYHSEFNGTNLLKKILGGNFFSYPKSLYLMIDILKITTQTDSIVLDFFAGSGTTGHGVLELNKEDNGNRTFILCTNNENNICTEVCYPRLKKVIKGYTSLKGEKVKGLKGNLKYHKTFFVGSAPTHRNKKLLTDKSIEMLCLKENTFDEVINKKDFFFFKSKVRFTAILFNELKMEEFKKEIKKLKLPISIYVFSLEGDDFREEFEDLQNDITLCSIPEAILKVYRRIYGTDKGK